MERGDYIPLHVHSHFSLGEGVASVERLARAAAALELKTLALTDTHSLAGMVRFVRACRAQGIRPIVGSQIRLRGAGSGGSSSGGGVATGMSAYGPASASAPSSSSCAPANPLNPPSALASDEPVVFLAQSEVGYRQLVRMISAALASGVDRTATDRAVADKFAGVFASAAPGMPNNSLAAPSNSLSAPPGSLPSVRAREWRDSALRRAGLGFEEAAEMARDLVALAGGRDGRLWKLALRADADGTRAWMRRLTDLFGRENLAIELRPPATPGERQAVELLVAIARELEVPCAATNEIRFLSPGEELILAFLRGEPVEGRRTAGEWLKTSPDAPRRLGDPEEFLRQFADFPEAVAGARALADRCTFDLPSAKRRFPTHNFVRGLDADSFIWDAVFRRATQRYGELSAAIKDRLNREFDYMRRAGLCNALVFLCRMGEDLDRLGIMRGPGAGPISTSVIASLLGLTRFDPMRFGLEFQPPQGEGGAEGAFPIFRIEASERRTPEVLGALKSSYPGATLCRVGRWERWKPQPLLDAMARWTGLPADRVGPILSSDEWRAALAREEARPESQPPPAESRLRSPEIFAYMVRRLAAAPRELAPVAGQYLLTVDTLTNVVPCEPDFSAASAGVSSGAPQAAQEPPAPLALGLSQIESEDLDHLSLARLEVAGDPMIGVLERAGEWVRRQENPNFTIERIPSEDAKCFQLLAEGWTAGLTPLETPTGRSLLRARRPAHIDDLIAALSDLPATRRAGRRAAAAPLADDPAQRLTLSLLCYAAAWLKTHHPEAFYAAALTQTHPRRKFRALWREARRRQIQLLPPDVNLSGWEFSREGRQAVRCGLMIVGGLNERAYREIEQSRRGMAFFDLADLARRTDSRRLRPAHIENLIRSGSCDSFSPSRALLLRQLPIVLGAVRPRDTRPAGGNGTGAAGTPVGGAEPLTFFDRPAREWLSEMTGDDEAAHEPEPIAQRIVLEQQAAGFPISADPIDLFADLLKHLNAIAPWQLTNRMDGRTLSIAGYVEGIERSGPLVRGDVSAILDLSGCLVFVPIGMCAAINPLSLIGGAVVVSGPVVREANEWRIKAESIQSLQAIWEEAVSTERLVLDLSHADRRLLKAILKILRQFPGRIPVQVIGTGEEPKRLMGQVAREAVLPCPPLVQALERILGRERLEARRREQPAWMLPAVAGAAAAAEA